MRLLLICCAALALASCNKSSGPQTNRGSPAAEQVPTKGIDRTHAGSPQPLVSFDNPGGGATSLKAFDGKPTLVNLWASWCAPCVKELPTLDRLARARGAQLNVVAISQDMAPHASVQAFLDTHKISTLVSYQDPKMALSGALDAEVLPTSILFDANGREIWRYVGDRDWTSPDSARLVDEAGAAKGS